MWTQSDCCNVIIISYLFIGVILFMMDYELCFVTIFTMNKYDTYHNILWSLYDTHYMILPISYSLSSTCFNAIWYKKSFKIVWSCCLILTHWYSLTESCSLKLNPWYDMHYTLILAFWYQWYLFTDTCTYVIKNSLFYSCCMVWCSCRRQIGWF